MASDAGEAPVTHVLRHWPTVIGSLLVASGAVEFAAQNVFGFGGVHPLPPAPTVWVAALVVTGCLLVARTRLVVDEVGLLVVGPLFTTALTWSEIDHVEPVFTRMYTYHLRIRCGTREFRALPCWITFHPFMGMPSVLPRAAGLIDQRRKPHATVEPGDQQVLRHWPTVAGWLLLALAAAADVALGLDGLLRGGGWSAAAFVVPGALVTAWALLLTRCRAVLEPSGLTVVGALRLRRLAWADVSAVRVRLSVSGIWTVYAVTATGPVDVLRLWWTLGARHPWMWRTHPEPPRLAPPSVHRAYRAIAAHLPR